MARFAAADGAAQCAVRAGGTDSEGANAIAADAAGNAVVTGFFAGTATFATAPTATNLVATGSPDVFVAQFAAADGAPQWALRAGGSGYDMGNGVAVDAAGNISVTGTFTSLASFGNLSLPGIMGFSNGFVARLGNLTPTTVRAGRQNGGALTLAPNPSRRGGARRRGAATGPARVRAADYHGRRRRGHGPAAGGIALLRRPTDLYYSHTNGPLPPPVAGRCASERASITLLSAFIVFRIIPPVFRMTRFVLSTLGLLSTLSPALAQTPTVTALQPARNAVAVPATTTVGVTFSQPISPASAGQMRVFGQQTGRTAGTASAAGSQLTFAPAGAFKPGETVQVTVPAGVQSAAGTAVSPQVYQFTTGVGAFGGGTFAAPVSNAEAGVSSGPQNLVLGDIDGDGDLDLVTIGTGSSGGYMISVRLNDGLNSGSFLPPASNANLTMGTGSTRALALGDLDNDGDLDMVACETLSSVGIWRNDGGMFVRPTNFSVTVTGVPLDIALGDVDADGDLDLVTANIGSGLSNGLSVRLNDGNGNFTAPAANANPAAGPGALRVLLGDVDGDGDLDAVVFGGNYVQLCLNTGLNSGNFEMPATGGRTLIDGASRAMAMGDVNGDGSLDLVLSRWQGLAGMVDVLLNDGTGAYVPWSSVAVTDKPQGLALGDVDGDGDLDLVVGNDNYNAQAVSVRLNGGVHSGSFFEPTSGAEAAIGARFPWAVALGDVNGDGQLDLVTGNNNNSGSGTGGGVGTASVRLNQVSALRAGLAPTVGPVGTQLTVRGTNLTGTTAVRFNGTLAPAFTVTSPTTLQVTVPSGATSGPVTISTPGGVLTSNTPFVLGAALAVARPASAALGVYPNPARTQVRVQAPAGAAQVLLYDALGRLTRTVPAAAGAAPTLLPLAGLPAGVYVVRAGAATARLLVE